MEIGDDMAGAAGYYSDLLNRVDTTITESRSAYGGEHAEEETPSTSTTWFLADRTIRFHTYVLWGPDDQPLPREIRSWLAGLFVCASCAVSLEMSRDDMPWVLQWLLTTIIVHCLAVAARLAVQRVDHVDARRASLGASVAASVVWIAVRLGTSTTAQLRDGFRVFVAVVTLGFVLAEAAARVVVSRCDPDVLRARRDGGASDDDLQYAAL
ncbi:hypothetical protein CTAYLR_008731 [Chrysophaeum taylorii]|uniref:Uncharacterized protein n=1 Tax=Chrysophaeum taylorii TaxID=2483200 RepID=A0AAD7UM42_9STRA|nr:hypothetical protein CTAYLR_008731 [Chrysophaeum taylorii]